MMTEETKIAELLKPRYKVILPYPHMEQDQIGVGDIISPYGMGFMYPDKVKEMYDTYPHLFRKLEWWEERKKSEMPKYIKAYDGQVYKIKDWDNFSAPYVFVDPKVHKGYVDHATYSPFYGERLPATKAEYESFTKSK